MMVLLDGGLRISELAGLEVIDIDLRDRIGFVRGKGSRRSGPRRRAVPLGVKAAQAVDRYGASTAADRAAEAARRLSLGDRL